MKHGITILILSFMGLLTYAQNEKLLTAQDFKSQKLDQEWVYVKPKPNTSKAINGYKIFLNRKGSNKLELIKIKVPDGKNPVTYCNELRQSGDFSYADPIVQYIPLATPTDPLITNQYYLDLIQAYEAWDITKGDDDITIGIIDSGLDTDHEDLINNLWVNTNDTIDGIDNDGNGYIDDYLGYDFADEDADPSIQNGNHGMIVGGIAGASTNNGKGIAGVGYNTKVAALKGFRTSNGFSNGLYEAIIYAAENGFDVVNLSWGRMGLPLQSEQDIINYAVLEHDMVCVAAAGNEGGKVTEENKWYPASYNHVLSVGATDMDDNKSSGSSFNHAVDLVAPGVAMYSTLNGNGYGDGGPGTSYSSPQVAAAAALVKDQFPSLSATQIMERVRSTADDIYEIGNNVNYDGKLGKGRLNVFRAVNDANVKSLRAQSLTLTSNFGENVFFGDTVELGVQLINYLSAVTNPVITISSPDDNFTISKGSFMPGYMGILDSTQLTFEIVLDDDIAPETTINIRLDYAASGYNDFQYLEVTTSPNYADFGNETLTMTISGDGDLGFNEYGPNFEGSGFQYLHDTLMTYAGLMLATNASSVSDNIISNYTNQSRNEDFIAQQNFKPYHHQGADHFSYSEFIDLSHPLIIEQSNITWENEDFLIVRYRIINNSATTINNLAFGIFADWDLGEKTSNYAAYDTLDNYTFVRNATSSLYAGVQVLGGDSIKFSALDMGAFNGNEPDVSNLFDDNAKYNFLVNQNIHEAGNEGAGNDVATINGLTINQLDSAGTTFIDVIYGVANDSSGLDSVFQKANDRLTEFLQKPRVLETFITCEGSSVLLDPSEGTTYTFYTDPLGQSPITTDTLFNATNITTDTLFYVRNLDGAYPSDLFEIRLKLFADISDFEMSTDTLYLDHPTTNVVQFEDKSLEATSWLWDFGQGTSSTLQNPSLSFSVPGTYQVSLSVENEQGCTDTMVKTLIVANRPSPPEIASITSCPGENVIINDPTADKINLYTFENQTTPTLSGINVAVPSVIRDTTVFISGVYDSFESDKVPLQIDVLEVNGSFSVIPDTTSESHQLILTANNTEADASIQWTVDGDTAGTTSSITIPAAKGNISVVLNITNINGCSKLIEKTIAVSSSAIAVQTDLISCNGDSVVLAPENGTYFGFYADDQITQLIKKGTQLKTNNYEKVYVVGLDDGLPGIPIEVNVVNENPEIVINYTSNKVGSKNGVSLSVSSSSQLIDYQWFLDGELIETVENPTLFLDNTAYLIVLEATTTSGCVSNDTLAIDFTPPLASSNKSELIVYPNPAIKDWIYFHTDEPIEELWIFSLNGKEVLHEKKVRRKINVSSLSHGLYLIKMKLDGKTIVRQIALK